MNEQLSLMPLPPQTPLSDPGRNTVGQHHHYPQPTEFLAAALVMPRTGTDRLKVLNYLGERGDEGATDEEISLGLRMRLYTAAPRRYELAQGGWAQDSGLRRPTTTGSAAIVWVLTVQGRQEWAHDGP